MTCIFPWGRFSFAAVVLQKSIATGGWGFWSAFCLNSRERKWNAGFLSVRLVGYLSSGFEFICAILSLLELVLFLLTRCSDAVCVCIHVYMYMYVIGELPSC